MQSNKRKTVDNIDTVDVDRIKIRRVLLTAPVSTVNRTVTFPDSSGTVLLDSTTSTVTLNGVQTLTNKTLQSSNIAVGTTGNKCTFVDQSDATKKVLLDTSGIATGKTLTLKCSNLNDQTIDLGDASDAVVYKITSQDLLNKNLNNSSVFFMDNNDNSKKVGFSSSAATTSTKLTLASGVTANRTVTFPDPGGNDNVLYAAASQTITNKSLNANSCEFYDNAGPTRKLHFDTNLASDNTSLILASKITSTRTVNFTDPGGNDDVLYASASQSTSNKTLNAANCVFADNATPSKKVAMSASGASASTTLTLASSCTANRTATFPDATGNVVLDSTVPTFTSSGVRFVNPQGKFQSLEPSPSYGSAPDIFLSLPVPNPNTTSSGSPDELLSQTSTATVTNKSLDASNCLFYDPTTASKKIKFTASSNTAGASLILAGNVSVDRTVTFPDPGGNDSVTYLAATQSLTNKSLVGNGASPCKIVDSSDATKIIKFDASASTTGTTTTIASSSSTSRTLTLPNGTDTLVGVTTSQSLANKGLNANNGATPCRFTDNADGTKVIKFDPVGNTTSTAATIATGTTANRTYTIPDSGADASFVMTAGNQTSIGGNKTFTGTCQAATLKVSSNGTSINNIQFGSFTSSSGIGAGATATIGTISLSGFSAVPVITLTMILPSPSNNWDGVVLSIVNGATSSSASVFAKNLNGGTTSGTVTVLWMAVGA